MNHRTMRHVSVTFVTVFLGNTLAAPAGDLNPPAGPVAPTMKTLVEVEPRTAVNSANTPGDADSVYKITTPGSYYLTDSITGVSGKHGIKIETDDVTLDLMGFALIGVPGSLDGVMAPPTGAGSSSTTMSPLLTELYAIGVRMVSTSVPSIARS